jgi:NAD-dependent dihydropyrimidine dehydrogenase PreA subunit
MYYVSKASAKGVVPGVQVIINDQRCRSCGICYKLCPVDVLGADAPLYKAKVVEIDKCTGCRLCELLCTDFAVNVVMPEQAAGRKAVAS